MPMLSVPNFRVGKHDHVSSHKPRASSYKGVYAYGHFTKREDDIQQSGPHERNGIRLIEPRPSLFALAMATSNGRDMSTE